MINLNIDYLCKAVNGQLINGQEDGGFCGITTDSRSVKPGQVYFAIQGEKHDGHQFVGHAFQNGAVAAVVKREVNHDFKKPLILVDDTIRALQMLAKEYRLGFKMPLIAVTGSEGKTTTKEILAQCLESSFITLKTKGNFNNDIGLHLTLLNIEANHATLAGHTFEHELRIAAINGMLGSIDANQGDYLLGWDTDKFPSDVYMSAMCMYEILKAGGLTGGINFDAKTRRPSNSYEDLIHGFINAMET